MRFDPDHYVLCPMPECEEPLHLTWSLSMALDPVQLDERASVATEDAHVATWQVGCLAGHVVLVPGRLGCPCPDDDQDGPSCHHDVIDYDWSEETRTFHGHDMVRLGELVAQLAQPSADDHDGLADDPEPPGIAPSQP